MPSLWARFVTWLRDLRRRPHWNDPSDIGSVLPPGLPAWTWLFGLATVLAVYFFSWSFVHVRADSRVCMGHSPDPLYEIIPHDRRWYLISHDLYIYVTLAMMAALTLIAFVRGDHRPLVRWGYGLAISAAQRCVTILLVPLCNPRLAAGTRRLNEADIPYVDWGFISFPWRPFATNDLLFSGHVAEIYLFLRVTRNWPAPLRAFFWAYHFAQMYALLATRAHYSIDILLAFPCTYAADRVAVKVLAWASARKRAAAPAGDLSPAPALDR